jgi:hypothetical protein
MDIITRAFEADLEVLKGEHAILARINTDAVDRLRTVIDPLGGDCSHFNKTRSVLWNHGKDPIRGAVPIGTGWVKVRRAERDMLGKTVFGRDKFSDDLFDQCEALTCRGWSIQAAVREASPPTKTEIRARPELEDCETIYRKWDLIEYSATPTPGNSDCLTMLVQRGLLTAPDGFVVPEPVVVPEPEKAIVRTERYIECDGTLWRIFEPDGSPVIAFPDPELAEECLRMMNAPAQAMNQHVVSLFGEMRAMQEARQQEIKEFIDLYRWGRV